MTSRSAHLRILSIGATAVLALTLTACSDDTSGSGRPAGAAAASGSAASGSASSGSGGGAVQPASDLTELTKTLAASTAQGTSYHLELATTGGGAADAAGNGQGDIETSDGGKTEKFSFEVGTGSSAVALVYVDGTGYVKLPATERTDPAKPWAKVSDTSSNPVVKAVAASFDQVDKQTSLTQYAALLESAKDFKATGPADVDGVAVQGYAFDIDPKDLPSAGSLGAAASELGPIPTTMAVDEQGRPVQIVEKISVAGQSITITVTISDYGKDIEVAAPPAAETTTD